MKKKIYPFAVILFFLVLDVITKYFIVKHVSYHDRIDFLGGFLRITLVYNEGGVFGIFQGYKHVFLIISIIVLMVMIGYFFYEKNKTFLFTTSMSLIISGAIGNIIDRVIPGRPGVVDFISVGIDNYYRWPSFNVADSVIVVGAFLLIIVYYLEEKARKNEISSE